MVQSMSMKAELRDRWTPDQTSALNLAFEKGSLDELQGLESFEDRLDIRGSRVSAIIRHRRFSDLDLSFSSWPLPGQFLYSELRNCLFDQADVPANLDHKFFACSFRQARMARVVLRGVFEDCDFERANLHNAGGSAVRFQGCSFKLANLTGAHLMRCSFERCDFQGAKFRNGSFAGSRFIDTRLDQSHLGNTIMERVIHD